MLAAAEIPKLLSMLARASTKRCRDNFLSIAEVLCLLVRGSSSSTHEIMSDMRAALCAARDAGDITLIEYLTELRKLRELEAEPSAHAAGSSAAPASGATATPNSAARSASDADSMRSSELFDENGSPYKRARVASGSSEELAPDSAPLRPLSRQRSLGFSERDDDDEMDDDQNGEEGEEYGDDSSGRHAPAPEEPPDETLFKENESVQHKTKGVVQVVRMGMVEDYFNHGRVYCVYKELKPGCATFGTLLERGAHTAHLILLTHKLKC